MQTTSGRGIERQAVQGSLDLANVPHNVVVTRTKTGAVEISSANPTLVSNYLLKTDFLNSGNCQHWMSCTAA